MVFTLIKSLLSQSIPAYLPQALDLGLAYVYTQTKELQRWNGKVGVKEKVEEVLRRKTIVADEQTLQWL
jgi:hypothetical protein